MCDYPLLAWSPGLNEDGKRVIKFLRRYGYSFEDYRNKYGDSLMLLPCGRCPSCLKAYSKTWSVRLMLESLFYNDLCFVTLTYENKYLPKTIDECKYNFQCFMKRLREKFPDRVIRYFSCIERGETTHRLHHHAILFGVSFDPDDIASVNELKQPCFTSKILEALWKKGIVSFGEVTPESCAYVARYSLKKKMSIDGKEDCALMMSTHPGIGYQFYLQKKDILYLSDRVYSSSFHGVSIPRYFDKLAENDPVIADMFTQCKEKRVKRGQDTLYSYMISKGEDSIELANRRRVVSNLKKMVLLKRGL